MSAIANVRQKTLKTSIHCTGTGLEAEADWSNLGSPEAYVGYGKAENFRSPGGLRKDMRASYAAAAGLPLNSWDLTGGWTVGREFATLGDRAGAIRFRFHARDAHLVLGGAPDGRPGRGFDPRARVALGRPLAHARDIGDGVPHRFG